MFFNSTIYCEMLIGFRFCLTGGRDREGRTIVTIPAMQKGMERSKEELATTLFYLVNTVSEEVRENGFCIVLDSRGFGWQTVKQTLRMLQVCLSVRLCVCLSVCVSVCVHVHNVCHCVRLCTLCIFISHALFL